MAVVGVVHDGAVQLLGYQLEHQRSKLTMERLQIAYDALVAFYTGQRRPRERAWRAPPRPEGQPESCAAMRRP